MWKFSTRYCLIIAARRSDNFLLSSIPTSARMAVLALRSCTCRSQATLQHRSPLLANCRPQPRHASGAAVRQSQNDRRFSLLLSQFMAEATMCSTSFTGEGETAMRQFNVGEVVTWIPDLLLRWETHGDYRIVAAMPDQDGHHMYRIKSPLEEYERVVKEDLLAKSNGYLPEEIPARAVRVTRRRSITLATLQPA